MGVSAIGDSTSAPYRSNWGSNDSSRTAPNDLEKATKSFKDGDYALAESLLKSMIDRDPNNDQADYLLGMLNFKLKKYDAAEKYLWAAVCLDKQNNLYHRDLGIVKVYLGKYLDAYNQLGCAIEYRKYIGLKDCDFDYPAHLYFGIACEKRNELRLAQKEYQLAVECAPANTSEAQRALGMVSFKLGDNETAKEELNRALETNTDDEAGHTALGALYYKEGKSSGDYSKAIKELEFAAIINKNNETAHFLLGLIYMPDQNNSSNIEQAEEHLKRVTDINYSNAQAHYMLGIIYIYKMKYFGETYRKFEAKSEFESAHSLDPTFEIPEGLKEE